VRNISKKTITSITLATLLAVGLVAANIAQAEEPNFSNPLVQRLAETFGLAEDDVQAVFDAARDEHRETMQTRKEGGLAQAVADGVLTQEQADALETKRQEMRQSQEEAKQQHHAEMQAWLEEQSINSDALMQYGGPGGFGGFGPHHGPKEPPSADE